MRINSSKPDEMRMAGETILQVSRERDCLADIYGKPLAAGVRVKPAALIAYHSLAPGFNASSRLARPAVLLPSHSV
jgi:hypothetical protein